MSQVVVDTDVVSYLFKNHTISQLYDGDLAGKTLVLSFMTIAELDRWALQARWGEARRNWLQRYLAPFVIAPFNRALCAKWADVTVAAQARGYRIECADAWIAATALLYHPPRDPQLPRLSRSSRSSDHLPRLAVRPRLPLLDFSCR